jgi:thymidylate synthase
MQMCKLLKENAYPELELGSFTHIANSYHIYERHFTLAQEMVASRVISATIPEIGENLIDVLGKPTPAFLELVDATEHTQVNYNTEDNLFKWIYEETKTA